MNEPVEDKTFDFLEESINAAVSGETLFELELHDTIFQKINNDAGIRIGDAESDFAPNQGDELQEYDAILTLVIYSKILGANKTERSAARKRAFEISRAVAKLFFDDFRMNNRVCDSRVLTAVRGWDSLNSAPYAVVNMPIVFNESGAINFNRRN